MMKQKDYIIESLQNKILTIFILIGGLIICILIVPKLINQVKNQSPRRSSHNSSRMDFGSSPNRNGFPNDCTGIARIHRDSSFSSNNGAAA